MAYTPSSWIPSPSLRSTSPRGSTSQASSSTRAMPAPSPSISSFSSIRAEGDLSFGELGDTPLEIPGLCSMLASHFFDELLTHQAVIDVSRRSSQNSNGVLVNTFELLEAWVVNALADHAHGQVLPPFYCVGPFVKKASERRGHECLAWLDGQPERRVVFLCFGSTGVGNHSVEQLKEITVGLQKSGQRFLWVVRAPSPPLVAIDDTQNLFDPYADPDLGALLPAGFLSRTSGRGIIVKLWAPRATTQKLNFHWLRAAATFSMASEEHYLVRYYILIQHNNGQLRDLLCSTLIPQLVHAIVIDTFILQALDVPKELGIYTSLWFVSLIYRRSRHPSPVPFAPFEEQGYSELGDTPLEFLGVPELLASHDMEPLLAHLESKIYMEFMNMCKKIPEFDGIMVNTFESLESRAVGALRDITDFLPSLVLPPVFCVGQLVKDNDGSVGAERHRCLAWLNKQPDRSVKHGDTPAGAAEGDRYWLGKVWALVVQAPHNIDLTRLFEHHAEPDLEVLLPKDFLEQTSFPGAIAKLWAPQVDGLVTAKEVEANVRLGMESEIDSELRARVTVNMGAMVVA
uniref:Uncharacterized protein n=1 Tax=Leersia perrieri TaxID=77586 RepID=A0A0D9WIV9_9ORYZ